MPDTGDICCFVEFCSVIHSSDQESCVDPSAAIVLRAVDVYVASCTLGSLDLNTVAVDR